MDTSVEFVRNTTSRSWKPEEHRVQTLDSEANDKKRKLSERPGPSDIPEKPIRELNASKTRFLSATGLLHLIFCVTGAESLKFPACDCQNAKYLGTVSLTNYSTCPEKQLSRKSFFNYELLEEESPLMTFKAFACRQFVKRMTRTSFFFGGYDTTFTTSNRIVSVPECWAMHRNAKCNGHEMIKDGPVWKYLEEPDGPPKWMQVAVYESVSCIMEEVELFQKCPDCVVNSVTGTVAEKKTIPKRNFQSNNICLVRLRETH